MFQRSSRTACADWESEEEDDEEEDLFFEEADEGVLGIGGMLALGEIWDWRFGAIAVDG